MSKGNWIFILVTIIAVIIAIVILAQPSRGQPPVTVSAKVISVTDGDTFKIEFAVVGIPDIIRVKGMDCPESRRNNKCKKKGQKACNLQIPKGKEATKRAKELLAGETVLLESAGVKFERDQNNRLLAYVRLPDGTDFGLLMIQEGLCSDFGWKYPHPRGAEYKKAEKAAAKKK